MLITKLFFNPLIYIGICVFTLLLSSFQSNANAVLLSKSSKLQNSEIGDTLDVFNGVVVYDNKIESNVSGRNLTNEGYNLGLKYQCVEFVKRYYYEYFNHKMPNSYGHAKDFFNKKLRDGDLNKERNLVQFSNLSQNKPEINDLLVFDATSSNPYGHVAIISKVEEKQIEIVQQNAVPSTKTREVLSLEYIEGKWWINEATVLGWLRKN